jgi:hypothetical protein
MSWPRVRRRVLLSSCLAAILILAFGSPAAHGWYDKVHMFVIQQALQLVARDQGGVSGPYGELLADDFARAMGKGGSDEDWGGVRGNERSFRHYFDPDGPGPERQTGAKFFKHYWMWKQFMGAEVTETDAGYYEGAMEWAVEPSAATGNMDGWQPAIDSYSDTDTSRWVAYYRLGHVGHLLGDMSETDHTRVKPHPGSGFVMPDILLSLPYEKIDGYLASNEAEVTPSDARALWAVRMALTLAYGVLKDNLESTRPVLPMLPERPDRWIGYEGLIEDLVNPDLVRDNLAPEDFAKRLRPIVTDARPPVPVDGRQAPIRLTDVRDYFTTLARHTNEVTGQRGLELPLGLADLNEYLDPAADAVQTLGSAMRTATQFPIGVDVPRFRGEKISVIPTINIYDAEAKRPFYELAFPLLGTATEYVAGLFELFHDIVSPPPFVKAVAVDQDGARVYEAAWKDTLERHEIPPPHVGPIAASGAYDIVSGRELVRTVDGTLDADRPAAITIRFGPSGGDSSLVRPGLDPTVVHVSAGPDFVQGSMVSADTWRGQFVPRNGPDGAGARQAIGVAAADARNHYPRPGLPAGGYHLDANPSTPARPAYTAPYAWTGYEPGSDRNHSVKVRRTQQPGPQTVVPPPRPQPAGPRNYSFTGQLDPDRLDEIKKKYGQIPLRIQSTPIEGRVTNGFVEFAGPVVFEAWEYHAAVKQEIFNRKTYQFNRSSCEIGGRCEGGTTVLDEVSVTDRQSQTGRVDLVWYIKYDDKRNRHFLTVANGRAGAYGDIPYILTVTEVR